MKHPIDVTYQSHVDHTGKETEGFALNLMQEDPSYAEGCAASEHIFFFERRADLEAFLDAQGLTPVYDEDAQDAIDSEGDE